MTVREHFNASGQWLFSHRSYIPLFLLPLIALAMFESADFPAPISTTLWWKFFCLVIALLGEVIRSIAVGTAAPFTSGRNTGDQLADSINTTGIYSVVRHPLYVGNFVTILGIVLWTGVWWFVLLVSVLYWFYYERIIFTEEQYLETKFGEQFKAFALRVPAVIPSFKHYQKAQLSFSPKIVMAREYDGVLAIFTSFAILEVLNHFIEGEALDLIWFWMFAAVFIITAFLRYARKHTSLLRVEGR